MSKGEWKGNKIICVVIILICIAVTVFCFLVAEKKETSENVTVEYADGEKVTLSVSVDKEEFFEKLSEKGVKIPPLFLLLPNRLEVLCDAEIRIADEDKKPSISIIALSFNGVEVPPKLLSEIGEINLDFKRSLVYN